MAWPEPEVKTEPEVMAWPEPEKAPEPEVIAWPEPEVGTCPDIHPNFSAKCKSVFNSLLAEFVPELNPPAAPGSMPGVFTEVPAPVTCNKLLSPLFITPGPTLGWSEMTGHVASGPTVVAVPWDRRTRHAVGLSGGDCKICHRTWAPHPSVRAT